MHRVEKISQKTYFRNKNALYVHILYSFTEIAPIIHSICIASNSSCHIIHVGEVHINSQLCRTSNFKVSPKVCFCSWSGIGWLYSMTWHAGRVSDIREASPQTSDIWGNRNLMPCHYLLLCTSPLKDFM